MRVADCIVSATSGEGAPSVTATNSAADSNTQGPYRVTGPTYTAGDLSVTGNTLTWQWATGANRPFIDCVKKADSSSYGSTSDDGAKYEPAANNMRQFTRNVYDKLRSAEVVNDWEV